MVGLDHETTFDPTKDNVLSMYYDYGWNDLSGKRWRYHDGDQRVLYSNQQAQMFVYAITSDNFNFKTQRLDGLFSWDLLEDYFTYESLDALREAWTVTDNPPAAEISLGSVIFTNSSTVSSADILKNIGTIGSDITVSINASAMELPDTALEGKFDLQVRGTNNLYSISLAKDGIYMTDEDRGLVLIPGSEEHVVESDDSDEWTFWFVDLSTDSVQVSRIYKNSILIYDESDELIYTSTDEYGDGDVRMATAQVSRADHPIRFGVTHIKISSILSGYGGTYDYDGYSEYGY